MKPTSVPPVPRIQFLSPCFAAAALLAGLFVAANPAPAAERGHGAHEHGVGQLSLAVDRVMSEGSCYDRDLAALAVKQARGDLPEAIFLLRAFRTTLPRFGASLPVETEAMAVRIGLNE